MVEIQNLSKRFGRFEVLKEINANFKSGKITAIAGPNGSGKTTLIKIILGLVKADSGKVYVFGEPINGVCSYRQKIGYMPQIANYPENLTISDIIKLIKELRNVRGNIEEKFIREFNLENDLNKPIRTLSGGTRQKVGAVLSLMFDPSVLIFDEPTVGMDPVVSSRFKEIMLEEKQKGKVIIITSHVMSEIEELADEILFLLNGKVYFSGLISELLNAQNETKLERAVAKILENQTILDV
ncbi:ABC transporter ATP-binding protein [Bacteroidetes/Chlorobi group bacterium MS-B_bin-24]|jgi:Cu-processing system ATP-binding protein|nr:MAG: ABC transporter ATP-binding protein [Bacteroidetes/Chlorobi group bacterium MS-B_bin-24]